MKSQIKDEMTELVRQHMQEAEDLRLEFTQVQELLNQKYADLEQRYQELSELYDGRPSRPEDLELIKKLRKENAQKDELLAKAAEDMKMYKLELENREFSYNKMFGTNPNVGVMDPTGKKGTAQAMRTAMPQKENMMGIGGTAVKGGPKTKGAW